MMLKIMVSEFPVRFSFNLAIAFNTGMLLGSIGRYIATKVAPYMWQKRVVFWIKYLEI